MTHIFRYYFIFDVEELCVRHMNDSRLAQLSTVIEFIFRETSSVMDISDRYQHHGSLFTLDSNIGKDDRLHIKVYKIRHTNSKLLLGFTEMPVKDLFEKVTHSFNKMNPNLKAHFKIKKNSHKIAIAYRFHCDKCAAKVRSEMYSPSQELTRDCLTLFNAKKSKVGHLHLTLRISCHGPYVKHCYPYTRLRDRTPMGTFLEYKTKCEEEFEYDECPL